MARVQANLLTDVQLRQWVRAGHPLARSDGGGLTFTMSSAGTAAWILRFRFRGRRQEVTIGRYPDISLAAARIIATRKRLAIVEGMNPADEARKDKAVRDWTVRELIRDYRALVLDNLAPSTQQSYGRNLKRIESWMGAMSVRSVGPSEVVNQIERVKAGWVETFTLWCVLRGLFKHAAGKKIIFVNPCAGIQLEAIIGKRPEVRRRLMLNAEELSVLMNAEMKLSNLYALRIILATGVRASELYTSLREDVCLQECRWHISTSKTGPAVDIPLAKVVVDWFRTLLEVTGDSKYVLPARLVTRRDRFGGDTHLSKDTIRCAIDYWIDLHRPNIRRFTPHDLRSTMKSHMRKLGVGRDISEMCLNHKLPGVEGIYDLHNYYSERREAFELWANFLESCRMTHQLNQEYVPTQMD